MNSQQMDALVLPGVGSAGKVMEYIIKKKFKLALIRETNKPTTWNMYRNANFI